MGKEKARQLGESCSPIGLDPLPLPVESGVKLSLGPFSAPPPPTPGKPVSLCGPQHLLLRQSSSGGVGSVSQPQALRVLETQAASPCGG